VLLDIQILPRLDMGHFHASPMPVLTYSD